MKFDAWTKFWAKYCLEETAFNIFYDPFRFLPVLNANDSLAAFMEILWPVISEVLSMVPYSERF